MSTREPAAVEFLAARPGAGYAPAAVDGIVTTRRTFCREEAY
jgi:hypothetical protein